MPKSSFPPTGVKLLRPAGWLPSPSRIAVGYLLAGLVWAWASAAALYAAGVQTAAGLTLAGGMGTLFFLLTAPALGWLVRRALSDLARANALLTAVAEGTTDAVYAKDRDGKYLLFNAAAGRVVGKAVADVLGRDDAALFDADGVRLVRETDGRVMASGAVVTAEERLIAAGVERTFLATKAPLRDAAGAVVGVVGISRDVTDRVRAEADLRAERDRFEKLVETAPAVIHSFELRPDGSARFPYASRRIEDVYGVPRERLAADAAPVFAMIHPADAAAVRTAIDTSARTLSVWHAEFRITHPTRGETWVEGRSAPVRQPDGSVVWHGFITDVTARKRTDQALRASEARLREAQRIARLGSWAWEPPTGRVWWSDGLYELFGLPSAAEPSLEAFLALLHPDDRAAARARVEAVLAGAEGFADELRVLRPDGRMIWVRSEGRATRDGAGTLVRVEGIDQDITDRKMADAALRASEWRVRLALEGAAAGTWSWEAAVGDTRWDDQFHANYGFGPADPRGGFDAWVARVHPDDRPRILTRVAEMRATPGDDRWEMEFRSLHPGGEVRWHHGLGRCERDAAGGIVRLDGIDIDVTARKRADAALRETEWRFRQVFENAATGIGITNADGIFLQCNPAYCAVLGRTADELRGTHLAELIHPDDRAENMDLFGRLAAGEIHGYEVENRFLHRSGEPRWVHKWVTALGGESGRAKLLMALVTDVTDRRRAEAALRASEERYRLLFESNPHPMWAYDRETLAFLAVNDAAVAKYGYTRDEFLAMTIADIRPPEDVPALRANVAAMTDGFDDAGVWRHRLKGGREIRVRVTSHSLAFAGRPAEVVLAQDVTAQLAAEDALRASEERLRLAQHAGGIGIYDWDVASGASVWTETQEAIYGLPPGTFTGRHDDWARRVHPDDRAGIAAKMDRDFRDRRGESESEYRIVRPDGEARWVANRAMITYDPAGRPVRMIGTTVDVTEQRRADEALRASEERYRRLVEVLPDAVFINADDRVTYCNPACVALFGAPDAAALLGKSPLDLFAAEYHEAIQARIREMRATGAAVPGLDERIVRLDGRTALVHVVATPIADRGRPAILVCLRDLSERERTLGLLRTVLGSVGDAILTIDARGRVETANPATERLFGYAEAELVGQNVRALMPEPDRGRHDGYIANYLRTGEAKVIGIGREVEARRKDGTTFPAELTVTEFRLDGGRRFTGVLRDISARRRLEDEFRQAQKMEAVGRLAGGVAHDFNNLLTVINGYADIILLGLPPDAPDRPHVAAVRDAGERAAALTSQLLAFSRKAIVAPKVFDLKDVAAQAERLLRRLIGEDVVLTLVLHPAPCRVHADPNQVDQVIMNLAVNARDAMPTGGRLTLEARPVTVAAADPAGGEAGPPPGRYIELAVADTGCGMPPEVQARIFEPFFTTKGEGQGTGLGLATVFGIVHQAGGHVSVESAVGRGTTFRVLLPEAQAAAPAADVARPAAARGTEAVLLVEDDPAVRQLSRLALETQGYRVVAAGNGREALDLLQARPGGMDVVVTDVVMPEMSGRQLADAVRTLYPGMKVLFVSGYTDDAVVRHGVQNAADAFLQKPFTPLGLARKVREVLDAAG